MIYSHKTLYWKYENNLAYYRYYRSHRFCNNKRLGSIDTSFIRMLDCFSDIPGIIMESEEHGQIMHQLGVLEGKVDGIISRQETANGRTAKLEGKVELIEKQQARADGRLTAYGWVFGAVIGIGGIVFAAFQIYIALKAH